MTPIEARCVACDVAADLYSAKQLFIALNDMPAAAEADAHAALAEDVAAVVHGHAGTESQFGGAE